MKIWDVNAMIESKRKMRSRLADLPFSEKIKILEKLRDRNKLIAASRVHSPGITYHVAEND